jgi:hypothetical protein
MMLRFSAASLAFPSLSGQPIPLHRFAVILGDALSFVVHHAEVGLRARVALYGSEPKPPHGFPVVLGDAAPLLVHDAEVALRGRVAAFGKRLEQPQRGSKIAMQVGSNTGFLFIERHGHCDRFRLERNHQALLGRCLLAVRLPGPQRQLIVP